MNPLRNPSRTLFPTLFSTPNPPPKPKPCPLHSLDPNVLKDIFDEYLTNKEKIHLLSCSKKIRATLRSLPSYQRLKMYQGLFHRKLSTYIFREYRPRLLICHRMPTIYKERKPENTPVSCFSYKTKEKLLVVGGFSPRFIPEATLWDTSGNYIEGIALSKPATFIDMDTARDTIIVTSKDELTLLDRKTKTSLSTKTPPISALYCRFAKQSFIYGTNLGDVVECRFMTTNPWFMRTHFKGSMHKGKVLWIEEDPECQRLFTGSEEGILHIWDSTEKPLATIETFSSHFDYDFSKKMLAAACNSKGDVGIWKAENGHPENFFSDEDSSSTWTLTALQYDGKNQKIYAGYESRKDSDLLRSKIVYWRVDTGKQGGFTTKDLKTLTPFPIHSLEIDPTTETLLTAGDGVQLWQTRGEKLLAHFPFTEGERFAKIQAKKVAWFSQERRLFIHKGHAAGEKAIDNSTLMMLDYNRV